MHYSPELAAFLDMLLLKNQDYPSTVVGLMTLVVCRVRRSVSAAYQMQKEKLAVSLKSLNNKLNATEVDVCEGLFLHAREQMQDVMQELNASECPLIPGYSTRILDGHQWAATEHRIKELRFRSSGPLPGKALVVWNANLGMISDVNCCEDSYTQERKISLRLLDNIEAGELWIAAETSAYRLLCGEFISGRRTSPSVATR